MVDNVSNRTYYRFFGLIVTTHGKTYEKTYWCEWWPDTHIVLEGHTGFWV